MNPNLRNCEIVKVINLAVSELVVNWQRFLLDTDISVTVLPRILEIWHCIILSMNSLQKILELFFFPSFQYCLNCCFHVIQGLQEKAGLFPEHSLSITLSFRFFLNYINKMEIKCLQMLFKHFSL